MRSDRAQLLHILIRSGRISRKFRGKKGSRELRRQVRTLRRDVRRMLRELDQ